MRNGIGHFDQDLFRLSYVDSRRAPGARYPGCRAWAEGARANGANRTGAGLVPPFDPGPTERLLGRWVGSALGRTTTVPGCRRPVKGALRPLWTVGEDPPSVHRTVGTGTVATVAVGGGDRTVPAVGLTVGPGRGHRGLGPGWRGLAGVSRVVAGRSWAVGPGW
jgi:hypothetical protein